VNDRTDRPSGGLQRLEAELREQLLCLNYPPRNWVPETRGPGGEPALDVAIVGAGMAGATAAFGLLRSGVGNIALFDAAPAGREGPWVTYARMDTLRSPKHLTSPDLGVPALTFRAWFEARRGRPAWEALHKIDRAEWMEYLVWLRRVLRLPVENGKALTGIEPTGELLRLVFADGTARLARRVVLATGREGSGRKRIPDFVDRALGPDKVAHTADPIDFARLKGKRVAVLGAGASAFDNAATALEAGAAAVDLFARRPVLPQVNKFKAMSYPGAQQGYAALPDLWRWRLTRYAVEAQVPPPHDTVHRTLRHRGFRLHLGTPWRAVRPAGAGIEVEVASGRLAFDFAILGTGFVTDLGERPELAPFAEEIALWRDRFVPPPGESSDEMAAFPYLGPGFEFREKRPGAVPFLSRIRCFNYGAAVTHGLVSGDIPGLQVGAERLARSLVEDLFTADIERHWSALVAADEAELATTPFHDPQAIRRLCTPVRF
jgi:cation diffusion facilitator CzcD-associated flavoprotein CzcO